MIQRFVFRMIWRSFRMIRRRDVVLIVVMGRMIVVMILGRRFLIRSLGAHTRRITVAVTVRATAPASAATAIAVLAIFAIAVFVVLFLGFGRFGTQQRLSIRDRNLVVVWMNFAEGEETVTVPAVFDEGSLKGRFDTRYAGEIDVSFELLLVLRFKIKFFDTVTADYDNPCFLRVGGVY